MTQTDLEAQPLLPASDWLAGPGGQRLLMAEAAALRDALDSVFGDDFVQIGAWGATLYPELARTRRHTLISDHAGLGASVVMRLDDLAIQSDSVDAVLLPHALEMTDNPHALLREVDRILRPDGHLITLGFNPYGFWGLRHLLSRRRFPPDTRRLIPEGRLCDWLRLLNYSVQETAWYHYRLPVLSRRRDGGDGLAEATVSAADSLPVIPEAANDAVWRSGWRRLRTWPPFAACYLSVARKEMYTVTPLRTGWRRRRRMVGGLVNPTPRNVA
jgi:SAM-dependent methyltransferase